MTVRTMMIRSSIIALCGVVLSAIGLAVHEFTPLTDRGMAPIIPGIATLGLALGAAWVIMSIRDRSVAWARDTWKLVAIGTAVAICLAALAIIITSGDVVPAVVMALVGLQGPLLALLLSREA